MKIDLTGRTALVTGASSGLGKHFATVLAHAGAKVGLVARRTDRLAAHADLLRSHGSEVAVVRMDVAERDTINPALDEIEASLGRVDILVNNAGTQLTKPAIEYQDEDFDSVVDVNLRGAFAVAQRVGQRMAASGGGSIVNIASILGLRQVGYVASYAIAKAGLIQMTKILALEWARHGIRVNAIAPGYIDTDLTAEHWRTPAGEAMLKRIPQRRLGNLTDLNGPLLLLTSDMSAYMTGSVVVVDGGHLLSTL